MVWIGLLDGIDDTEIDGCADYCEGLCDVSDLHDLIVSSFVGFVERTWRGVNHQRLPVDAIVIVVVVLMSCGWWYCGGCCCYKKRGKGRETTEQRQSANANKQ